MTWFDINMDVSKCLVCQGDQDGEVHEMVCNVLNADYYGFTFVQEIQFLGNYSADDLCNILWS